MNINRRVNIYNYVSDLAHDLFDEIYGSYNGFINAKIIHPLEEYIIVYDENMEDDSILIQLGERMGFGLEVDETGEYTVPEQFYDRCSYTIRYNESRNITKIMDMTEIDFKKYLKSMGLGYNKYMYSDRLNIDSHKYNKELVNAYLK